MFYLERACKQQIMAQAAGPDGLLMAPQESVEVVRGQMSNGLAGAGKLAWPGALRQLDRSLPGYDA